MITSPEAVALSAIDPTARIKWAYSTRRVPDRPAVHADLSGRLCDASACPRRNDVFVAEVVSIGRHTRIESPETRRTRIFEGDLVGLVYGNRYATKQFEGIVPADLGACHIMSVAGCSGHVVGMSSDLAPPTIVRPLGRLLGADGRPVNLADHALVPTPAAAGVARPTVVLVVGSSMDAGKTTTCYSLVRGLALTGRRVGAAKLTGTAASKDPMLFHDAGAFRSLDFSDAGHVSTAGCAADELARVHETLTAVLAGDGADVIVLEIADGVVQRETVMLMDHLGRHGLVDHVLYACTDTMGIQHGVEMVERHGLRVRAVTGRVTMSPLSTTEGQAHSPLPVVPTSHLQDAAVAESLLGTGPIAPAPEPEIEIDPEVSTLSRRTGAAAATVPAS